jgi:hypothetical protein
MVAAPALPDSVSRVVSKLGGKTSVIHSPGDLAKAIDRLEKLAKSGVGTMAAEGIK